MLTNIRIVLVETSHPGNIGAAARAMKNMGLGRLVLVNPRHFPDAEATARASGADDVLAAARVCSSLEEAVADCSVVFGASARLRTIPWPQVDARTCAGRVASLAGREEIALVFGREKSGLTNEELQCCNYLVHIPSNGEYSSLNLAAAVQVLAYELRMAHGGAETGESPNGEPLALAGEVEQFYAHLEQAMVELEFLDPDNPRQLMRRLRRLFNRAALEKTEVNILRGVLSAAQKKARR